MKSSESRNYILAIIAIVLIVGITWFVVSQNTGIAQATTSRDTAGAATATVTSAATLPPVQRTLVTHNPTNS